MSNVNQTKFLHISLGYNQEHEVRGRDTDDPHDELW
jgi:hypothetical protein